MKKIVELTDEHFAQTSIAAKVLVGVGVGFSAPAVRAEKRHVLREAKSLEANS